MTYATLATLSTLFGEREVIALTDRDLDGVPDQDVLDANLASVDSIIDSHLAARYTVPLADVPPIIVAIAGHLFRYQVSGAETTETDPIRARYRDAIRLLESIRDGLIKLGPDAAGDTPAAASGGGIRVMGGVRRFTNDNLDGDYL